MSRDRVSWHAEDSAGAAVRIGDRPVHAFWPLLRANFRWVLLEPHRRASGDAITWFWSAPRTPASPASSDLAGLRQRLGNALVDLAAELDRREAQPGTQWSGELHSAMESMVRALMRTPDDRLAAYAVLTDGGWMIRSWGVAVPAKAECAEPDADENLPPEENPDHHPDEYAPHAASGSRRRKRWPVIVVSCTLLILLAGLGWVIMRSQKKESGNPVDTTRSAPPGGARPPSETQPDANGGASGPASRAARQSDSFKLPSHAPGSHAPGKGTNAGSARTGTGSASAAPLHPAARMASAAPGASPSAATAGGAAFAELAASTAQVRDAGPERPISVPGAETGTDTAGAGGTPSGDAIDTARTDANSPPSPGAAALPAPGVARAQASSAPHPPADAVPKPLPAPGRAAAPTVEIPHGMLPPPPSASAKPSPRNTATSPAPNTSSPPAAPAERKEPDNAPSPAAIDSSDSVQSAVPLSSPPSVATPPAVAPATGLKSIRATRRSSSMRSDDASADAQPSSPPARSGEPAGSSAAAEMLPAEDSLVSADARTHEGPVARERPAGLAVMRTVILRFGEWRSGRVSDVVLPTWPSEQGATQILRAARAQALTQTRATQPRSFQTPRVRSGWSLRVDGNALHSVPPVWRDAASGRARPDTWIAGDAVGLDWEGLVPADDIDARLVAADGRVLARLKVSVRWRRTELAIASEVREAAPWFAFTGVSGENVADGFHWQSLRPDAWPDQSWERTLDARGLGVVCHALPPAGKQPVQAVVAVVHPASGWGLSCGFVVEPAAAAP